MAAAECPACGSADLLFLARRQRHLCRACEHEFAPETASHARRVFLSYGHDEHAALALRLKADLETRGHEIWFDLERLRAGADWESYIERGLDWVAEAPGRGRVLLLLTPHSVRRPDGYCLNEIARAVGRRVPVIPIMVVWCEPPLSICRIQWLDLQDCVPVAERLARYEARLPQVVRAIEEDGLDAAGGQARLVQALAPLPFEVELADHVPRFTGRRWVFDRLDAWLKTEAGPRVFWITGSPGIGKTALASWFCFNRPEVAAFHLCRHGDDQKASPRRAVSSIAYQLASQLPDYQARLSALPLEQVVAESNARSLFDALILQPLSSTPRPGRTLVIVIDGLDEATEGGRNELASFIATEFGKTPDWLRLVITSRPEPEVMFPLQGLDPYVLDASAPENDADIRAYLAARLAPHWQGGAVPTWVVEAVAERSEGLFLYVETIRRDLEAGRLSLDRVDEFPRGLGQVYAQIFQREFPPSGPPGATTIETFERSCLPALEMLAAARAPLPVDLVAGALGWDTYARRRTLAALGSLFPVVDGCLRPFHASVIDWLTDGSRAGPYAVEAEAGHMRLADHGWREYQSGVGSMSAYALASLPLHLRRARRWHDLEALLTDLAFIEARARAGSIFDLVGEYQLVLTASVERTDWPGRAVVQDFARFVQARANVLAQHPSLVFQEAANQPAASRPAMVARSRWEAGAETRPWLDWANRPDRGDPCLMTLTGHDGPVSSCGFSPDGRFIVSGSEDRSARLWNAETGKELACVRAHKGSVRAALFLPDGKTIVTGAGDASLKLWDPGLGVVQGDLVGHTTGIVAAACSPDGRRLVSASRDRSLIVWDVASRQKVRTLKIGEVWACDWSGDGRLIASGGGDGRLELWDAETGALCGTLTGHRHEVRAVAFSPDGRHLVSGSADDTVKIWDRDRLCEIATLVGHDGSVQACAVSPEGRLIASASADRTIRIWELESGRLRVTLAGHSRPVHSCAFSPDGARLVSGAGDGTLKVWEVRVASEAAPPAARVEWSLVEAARVEWSLAEDEQDESDPSIHYVSQSKHQGAARACAISPDGAFAVTGSSDKTLMLWDLASGADVFGMEGHWDEVSACAWSADGRFIVSASHDRSLKIWDAAARRLVRTLSGHADMVTSCAISPDSRYVLSASWDRSVRLWDAASGAEVRCLSGHTKTVGACAFAPDGRYAVSGSWDHTLRLWDLQSGSEAAVLEGHTDAVSACACSPDGRWIVSGSYDGTLRVWDASRRTTITTLAGHARAVFTCAFSADGQFVISGGRDQTVRVWERETGAEIGLFASAGSVHSVTTAVPPDVIVAADAGGGITVLKLRGRQMGAPILTVALERADAGAARSSEPIARCRWCGRAFAPPPVLVAAIVRLSNSGTAATVPSELLPTLICGHCHRLLRFTPFFTVDLGLRPAMPEADASARLASPSAREPDSRTLALAQRGVEHVNRAISRLAEGQSWVTREVLAEFSAGLSDLERAMNQAPSGNPEIRSLWARAQVHYGLARANDAASRERWDDAIGHLRHAQKFAESHAGWSGGRDDAIGGLRRGQNLAPSADVDRHVILQMLARVMASRGISRARAAVESVQQTGGAAPADLVEALRSARFDLDEACRLDPADPDLVARRNEVRDLLVRLGVDAGDAYASRGPDSFE
jgi:WD40 repeat protein